jgi:hypothetical protein
MKPTYRRTQKQAGKIASATMAPSTLNALRRIVVFVRAGEFQQFKEAKK